MPARLNVERALAADLGRARFLYEQTSAYVRGLIVDVPSHIPHPDEGPRIKNAEISQESAKAAYVESLREFNGFIVDGVIPDRLKKGA